MLFISFWSALNSKKINSFMRTLYSTGLYQILMSYYMKVLVRNLQIDTEIQQMF